MIVDNINSKGINCIADVLKINRTLKSLDLSGNKFENNCFVWLEK